MRQEARRGGGALTGSAGVCGDDGRCSTWLRLFGPPVPVLAPSAVRRTVMYLVPNLGERGPAAGDLGENVVGPRGPDERALALTLITVDH